MTAQTEQKIPAGYKQTQIGVIPEDWDVKKLGELLKQSPQYGINAPSVKYDDNLPTYIRITDISGDGRFLPNDKTSVNHFLATNYYLEDGDLVFARTGASVGKTYLYDIKDGELVFAGFLIRVKCDPNKLNPKYLYNFTKTKSYWNWVLVMSMRSGQPGINGNEYKQLILPIPPTTKEQNLITSVLSDVDSLIEKLEKLIEKKKNIKLGTMQELHTGKRRLPGFARKWNIQNLASLGSFRGGNGFPLRYQGTKEGDYPFYKVSDMNNEGNSTFMFDSNNWISKIIRKQTGANTFPANTIVFAKIGAAIFLERKKILSQESCIDNNMMGFVLNENVANPRFMHYLFLNIKLGKLVSATALPSLNGKEIGELIFGIPEFLEQTAIANVLSDMDAEIEKLESQLTKYKNIKQGMMQNLLTGKIRLIKK